MFASSVSGFLLNAQVCSMGPHSKQGHSVSPFINKVSTDNPNYSRGFILGDNGIETQSFVSPSKKDIGDCTGLKWRLLGTLLALNPYLKPTCNAPLLCETGSKGSITGICLLN